MKRDPDAEPAEDLVNRNFTVDRPNKLWVTGKVYAAVVLDAWSRRVVG